jgi:uncharacterized protein YjiS (DUF1127 family)
VLAQVRRGLAASIERQVLDAKLDDLAISRADRETVDDGDIG